MTRKKFGRQRRRTFSTESNMEINSALADSKMRASFADLGSTPLPVSPADFGKFIVEEAEKWGKVIKFAGIKPG